MSPKKDRVLSLTLRFRTGPDLARAVLAIDECQDNRLGWSEDILQMFEMAREQVNGIVYSAAIKEGVTSNK